MSHHQLAKRVRPGAGDKPSRLMFDFVKFLLVTCLSCLQGLLYVRCNEITWLHGTCVCVGVCMDRKKNNVYGEYG